MTSGSPSIATGSGSDASTADGFVACHERLWQRAETDPEKVVFTAGGLGEADAAPAETLTFAQLARAARSMAAHLAAAGVERGDRVVLALPNGLAYPISLYGAMAAGAIAVPLFPPTRGKHQGRVESVLLEARPAAVVSALADAPMVSAMVDELRLGACRVLTVEDDFAPDAADRWRPVAAHEVAFLQYTSGSTSAPKGVMVGQANVAANSAAIGAAFSHDHRSTGVCWLPLFHDMGIVGSVLHTVEIGARCHLMAPTEFLVNPSGWLRAISALSADTSGGPNFAFDWCVRRAKDHLLEGVDLSRWRVAYNGSEPISATTLDRFTERFEPFGFRREAFLPCYGLAEYTLLVSGASVATPGMVASFDDEALRAGRVVPADPGAGRRLVASGAVEPSAEVRIVDDEEVEQTGAGEGQILVAGPSRTLGYWRSQVATEAAFGTGSADPHPGFLRTGDLGFVHKGLLFVTGRAKELIVVRGRNLHPHDVEAAALTACEGAGGGEAVAFAVPGEDGEDLAVLVEASKKLDDKAGLARRVRLAVSEATGVQARHVGLVARRTIPKTSSGKLRRLELASMFGAGGLELLFVDEFITSSATRPRPDDVGVPYREPEESVGRAVAAVWSSVLGIDGIGLDDDFLALGGDSLQAARIAADLAGRFDVDVQLSDLFDTRTVAHVVELIERLKSERSGDDLVDIEL